MPLSNDFSQFSLFPFSNQLIQSGYASLPQMQRATIEARQSGRPLIEILEQITGRPLPPSLLHQYKQHHLFTLKILHGIDFLDLVSHPISIKSIEELTDSLIPLEFCCRYCLLPLQKIEAQASTEARLLVGMVNPSDLEAQEQLHRLLRGQQIRLQRLGITKDDYEQLLEQHTQRDTLREPQAQQQVLDAEATIVDVTEVFEEIPPLPTPRVQEVKETSLLLNAAQAAPIVHLVNKILAKAVEEKASEIHLEPQAENLSIRCRQGGNWRELIDPLPKKVISAIASRLKMMAELDITQCKSPQKGRIRKVAAGQTIYFLLQTMPSFYGEKIAIRLLNSSNAPLDLDRLIVDQTLRQQIQDLTRSKSGLLLVSGPGNCEIATTLYALLGSLERPEVNIATIEENISHILPGITQIEVDAAHGMDYQSVLQSLTQQDIDILMIDRLETPALVQAAIETAHRGCLVLAGIEANDPISAIAHLSDTVKPKLLAETLTGVINQRLVRRLCPTCRLLDEPTSLELAQFGITPAQSAKTTFYKANTLTDEALEQAKEKGKLCRQCHGTGYHGQLGIYEVLCLTPALREALVQQADRPTLSQAGMTSLLASGLSLVFQGQTTLEELLPMFPKESLTSATVTETIQQRLEKVESLLAVLTEEFQSLKDALQEQETSHSELPPTHADNKTTVPPLYEEMKTPQKWEKLKQDIDLSKETIAGDSFLYEELTDPGEWEDLKKELDVNKETMAFDFSKDEQDFGTEHFNPFKSVPDPWSTTGK